jgi:predicted NBD/HSP70 family sugar kinase
MFVYSPTKHSLAVGSPANRNDLRSHNSALVLRVLWSDEEGASRSELARATGLSKATVSAIVRDLMEAGLVAVTHQRASGGGRPGKVLQFQYDRYSVVGVEMGASHVTVVRTDLAGKIQASESVLHDLRSDPHGGLELIHRLVSGLIDTAGHPVIGLGVGVPTPLHAETPGRLSPRILPNWKDIDLRSILEARHGLPLRIENDANLGALAEHWWGAGRGVMDFTYVKVSTGVGAGFIIGGEIYRGAGGIAGELGHTIIDVGSSPSQVNDMVGAAALIQRARAAARALDKPPAWMDEKLDIVGLVSAARAGEPLAVQVIQQAGHWLGVAFANLYNLVNPSRVIIGGPLSEAGDILMVPLSNALAEHVLHIPKLPPDVRVTSLKDEAIALGGATAILQEILTDPRLLQQDHFVANQTTSPASFFTEDPTRPNPSTRESP